MCLEAPILDSTEIEYFHLYVLWDSPAGSYSEKPVGSGFLQALGSNPIFAISQP